jgi:hypothetical protein
MQPKTHILLGLIFSTLLYIFFEKVTLIPALIIFFSSWLLIDLDHAIRYTLKTKNLNPIKFWEWSIYTSNKWKSLKKEKKKKYKSSLFIFHNIETLLILYIISFYYPIITFIIIGFIFHLFLDLIHAISIKEDIFIKISLIYVLLKNIGKKEF